MLVTTLTPRGEGSQIIEVIGLGWYFFSQTPVWKTEVLKHKVIHRNHTDMYKRTRSYMHTTRTGTGAKGQREVHWNEIIKKQDLKMYTPVLPRKLGEGHQ